MMKYITEQKKKCGLRIKRIRELLGYTEADFGKLMGLTENTIINIEKGDGFNSNTISIVSYYTGISLKDIFDFTGDLPNVVNLKYTFLKNVKKYNNETLIKLLNRRITIKAIIEELVNKTSYFKTPKRIKEIREYIHNEYNKNASSSIVSQALSNAYNDKLLKRTRDGMRNYSYFKDK